MTSTETTDQEQTIKLYGFVTSPFVQKVVAFLEYKRLPYGFCHVHPLTRKQIRFTDQKQVPVLKIGDEWRKDSSAIGRWLDERFTKRPIFGRSDDEKLKVAALDNWVNNRLIPARFREAIDWHPYFGGFQTGWRYARLLHNYTPLPWYLRLVWPLATQRGKFIWSMMEKIDRRQPLDAMWYDLLEELESAIEQGPFMGGFERPTAADLSAYSVLISGWLLGQEALFAWRDRDVILKWMAAVQKHLPDNPLSCDDRFLVRPLPF